MELLLFGKWKKLIIQINKDVNKENASKLWKMIQEAGDYLLCQWDTLPHTRYANNLKFS